jgi:hypothetical protein
MLWNCSADEWLTPQHIDDLVRTFPEDMAEKEAPEHTVEDCYNILSSRNSAEELGLRQDLSDSFLAPPPMMHEYLNRLYQACLSMRLMKNHGHRSQSAWENLDAIWTERAQHQAVFNGQAALALLPVPSALISWDRFNEGGFRKSAVDAAVGNRMLEEILFLSGQERT